MPDDADLAKQAVSMPSRRLPSLQLHQQQEDIGTQLDPKLTFNNYMEGDSNKLPRSVGLSLPSIPIPPSLTQCSFTDLREAVRRIW